MNLRILPEAEAKLDDAIARYESIEASLGVRLKKEAKATLAWIAQNPDLPRMRLRGYRRVNLKVFPYYAAYITWGGAIWILAVAHTVRRPEYWIGRRPRSD